MTVRVVGLLLLVLPAVLVHDTTFFIWLFLLTAAAFVVVDTRRRFRDLRATLFVSVLFIVLISAMLLDLDKNIFLVIAVVGFATGTMIERRRRTDDESRATTTTRETRA